MPTAVADDAPLLMIGHLSSDEQRPQMVALLDRFSAESGVAVRYESDPLLPELLKATLERDTVPDLILLPVPNWVAELATAGAILPLTPEIAQQVQRNFAPAWQALVTVDGQLYGVPFDARSKSLLVARPGLLPEEGLPSVEALLALAESRAAQGEPTFAVPGEIGWTLTDTFENVLLATAGPTVYDDLRDHRVPWTDPAVEAAMREWLALLQDEHLVGGVAGAIALPLRGDSFAPLFDAGDPQAAIWWGPADVIDQSGLTVPDEVALSRFPGGGVVGVGSVVVATNNRPETMALLSYLTEPEAVRPWVEVGGLISPNRTLPLDAYPTELARAEATQLVEAEPFRYDLSDRLPPNLGGTYLSDQLEALLLAPERLPDILSEIESVATREQGSAER